MTVTLNEPYDFIWYGPYDMVSPNAHWAMSHGPSTCENYLRAGSEIKGTVATF